MEAEPGTEKSIKLDGDESVEEVGKILKKAGLIRDARTFTIQAKCYGYEVNAGTTSKHLEGFQGADQYFKGKSGRYREGRHKIMITENRLTTYINSLAQGDGSLIETIAENAVKNRVPIIRRETASLLKTMVTLVAPNRILEVGTAVGYSALLMASVMPKSAGSRPLKI